MATARKELDSWFFIDSNAELSVLRAKLKDLNSHLEELKAKTVEETPSATHPAKGRIETLMECIMLSSRLMVRVERPIYLLNSILRVCFRR